MADCQTDTWQINLSNLYEGTHTTYMQYSRYHSLGLRIFSSRIYLFGSVQRLLQRSNHRYAENFIKCSRTKFEAIVVVACVINATFLHDRFDNMF